ncbi:uncharacterized protein LOC123511954 [Portunus trituberculatus]|uniref:uncharacterized protein LOC123511954 n=1 Tax=Portunus trituberculatus TaxID=210409 RepID=UPI001E1CC786|nr:uncharacterized protein LOC123511954 [Portunus trituberculatus]
MAAVQAILSTKQQQECPVLLLLNNPSQITLPFLKAVETAQALQGVTVFQIEGYNLNANASLIQLRSTVDKIRQLGGMWHCLVVVVVSDDPAFLSAFAHLSLRRHALRWSTRILVFTRLSLSHLGGLHALLSNRNAMLLLAHRDKKAISGVGVYVSSPYSLPSARLRKVDTWTPNTTWAHSTHLFPEKFLVFSSAPTLTIAIELLPQHKLSWEEDPHAPDGRRLVYTGALDKTVQYFAKGMNFTYRYVLSLDRTFGRKLPNGSWTGMMGMIVREETDFGLGPFSLSPVRVAAADHTIPIWTGNMKMVSGLTGLKVDPWGFLLPLRSLVWTTTLIALLGVLAALQIFSSCLSNGMFCQNRWSANIFSPVRALLQQGESSGTIRHPPAGDCLAS